MEQEGATQGNARGAAERLRIGLAALPLRLVWRATELGAGLRDCLDRELSQRIGFQWLAVAFGLGALVYFTLPAEPFASALILATLIAAVWALVGYRSGAGWRMATIVAVCFAGTTAAKLRVERLDGPRIDRGVTAQISGRVLDAQRRADRRPRIILDRVRSDAFTPEDMPQRIRLTLSEKHGLPPLGSRISLLARLQPVPGAAVPGGYDPRRAAFFEGIGGSGFVLGAWKTEQEPSDFAAGFLISRVRAAIVARIMTAQPGEAGAVAAALLVGERGGLSEETNESLRISGLAHILSISGLHMMLIAGTAFTTTRAALALSPRLALAYPIRKWAALIALVVVTMYLALSGGGAATLRAYVMAAIMFVAILVDRPAISMRNLAIAAFVVLALEPEGVAEPGFQMSFAAVTALVAGWEAWHERSRLRLADESAIPGWPVLRYARHALVGVALTSLIAGLATAPFAAYHFERIATYSLLGNLLTAPLTTAVIMPFGLLTLVVMPLGLEALPLAFMAWGIKSLLWISDWVASLPGADASAPRIGTASLVLISAGMLWLCLWRLRWRLFGLPLLGFGLALLPFGGKPPDILVSPEGSAVAVRDATGILRVSGARAGSYVVEQFFDEEPGPTPNSDELRNGVRCDELACVLAGPGLMKVAHVIRPEAFAEDCGQAQIVVTALPAPADCLSSLVIDRARLDRSGAHAIWTDASRRALVVTTDRSAFPRPWQAGASAR